MATNEELEQRIKELESLVTSQYDPPSGPEYSFPVPGQPIDQDQFQLMSLADGNGIVDRGYYPYWLEGWETDSETNQKNSLILRKSLSGEAQKSEAVIGGYYHVMTEDQVIPLDPVLEETSYHICLTFDPRVIDEDGNQANGAISVQVYDSEPPTTFGRIHIVLAIVTRKPNQLLSDAHIERYRQRVSAPISVLDERHLPDPSSVLYGSVAVAYEDHDIHVARNTSEEGGPRRWDPILSPKWVEQEDSADYANPGHGYQRSQQRIGNDLYLSGRVSRKTGTQIFSVGGGGHDAGYRLFRLRDGLAPSKEQRFITATNNYSGNRLCAVTAHTDGYVYGAPILGDCNWISLDGIRIRLK